MTTAENIVALFDGGYKDQAMRLLLAESVTVDQDWMNATTTYFFQDGSAMITTGPDCRIADTSEKP